MSDEQTVTGTITDEDGNEKEVELTVAPKETTLGEAVEDALERALPGLKPDDE